MPNATVALSSDGEIWSWGNPAQGRLGRAVTAAAPQHLPGRVGDRSDWAAIGGGNPHILALSEEFELYAWGNNAYGQLGIGTTGGHEAAPVFVLQAYGFAGFSQTGAGQHSMALIRTEPIKHTASLEKQLQKPVGTPVPNLSFTFTFTPHSFNNNTAYLTPLPTIPTRTVTINSGNTSTPNYPSTGITTTTNSVDALAGIQFSQPGIYAWTVAEVQSATGIGPNSSVVFSQASYRLRVYVAQEAGIGGNLYIYSTIIQKLTDHAGDAVYPLAKVDNLVFENIYTRVRPADALTISKSVTGQFANLNTPFYFDITLARTAFCPPGTEFVGRVVDNNNNPILIGEPPEPRTHTFESGIPKTVTLAHNQRLVFDKLMVGARFSIIEQASPEYVASVVLYVGGTSVNVAPNTAPNLPLPIGNHLVGAERNTADFTNNHALPPPTGLSVVNSPYILAVLAAVGIAALVASRRRKRIEELPTL